jgi:hypothetical protein
MTLEKVGELIPVEEAKGVKPTELITSMVSMMTAIIILVVLISLMRSITKAIKRE